MKRVQTTLAISTYNWPQALNLCLLSVLKQKVLPDEVIIADDGSTDGTRILIEQFQKDFPVPLIHVWQPDEGFQLSKIRNRAIAAASYEYIIQVDGDLILHPHFVADHLAVCKYGFFASGSRVTLDADTSQKLIDNSSTSVNLFNCKIRNKLNGLRLPLMRNYLALKYKANEFYYLRGCNIAFWRKDLLKVNGFNEDFIGWGLEDTELAVRLHNIGIKRQSLKFSGIVYHVYHHEENREALPKNRDLLSNAIERGIGFCYNGVNKYL